MPPVLALAPLAGSVLGAELLPLLGGMLGGGELLGGAGLFGATLGETLGGALGGGAVGALTNEKDPLLGGALGAVGGGIGGPGLASGLEGALSGVGDLVGLGTGAADAATGAVATAAPTSLTPAAGANSSALTGNAAAIAAPEGVSDITSAVTGGAGPAKELGSSFDSTLGSSLTPAADTAGSASPGASLTSAPLTGTGTGGPAGGNTFNAMLSDPSWKTFGDFAGKNKDLIMSGLGLGATALQGDKSFPGEDALRQQARALGSQGSQFMRGELTPGMKAGLRGATESAKATMRSMFASRGMSGSSSEAEALAQIDITASVKGAEIAQSLIDRGIKETELSGALWQNILRTSMARDDELGKAIGSFASAMAR